MRSGWDADAHQLIVDVGPLGCPTSSGHGHADLLSVQCVGLRRADSRRRRHLLLHGRCAVARFLSQHRGSQHGARGPDETRRNRRVRSAGTRARARRLRDVAFRRSVRCPGCRARRLQRLADPVTCRRRVIFVKPHYWLLVDDLDGRARIRSRSRFSSHRCASRRGPHPWVRAETPGDASSGLRRLPPSRCETYVECGELAPDSWLDVRRLRPARAGADADLLLDGDAAVAMPDAAVSGGCAVDVAAGRAPALRRHAPAARARVRTALGVTLDVRHRRSRRRRRRAIERTAAIRRPTDNDTAMCGIAGIVNYDPRVRSRYRTTAADARRPRPSRP